MWSKASIASFGSWFGWATELLVIVWFHRVAFAIHHLPYVRENFMLTATVPTAFLYSQNDLTEKRGHDFMPFYRLQCNLLTSTPCNRRPDILPSQLGIHL